jgi:hypothetical protein
MAIPTFEWRGAEKPADADEWERIVREDFHDPIGGLEIVIERVANGWRVLSAMSGGYSIRTGPTIPAPLPRTDERDRVTRVLREAGRPVVD